MKVKEGNKKEVLKDIKDGRKKIRKIYEWMYKGRW